MPPESAWKIENGIGGRSGAARGSQGGQFVGVLVRFVGRVVTVDGGQSVVQRLGFQLGLLVEDHRRAVGIDYYNVRIARLVTGEGELEEVRILIGHPYPGADPVGLVAERGEPRIEHLDVEQLVDEVQVVVPLHHGRLEVDDVEDHLDLDLVGALLVVLDEIGRDQGHHAHEDHGGDLRGGQMVPDAALLPEEHAYQREQHHRGYEVEQVDVLVPPDQPERCGVEDKDA